jgi:hypothetical protein
MAIPDPRAYMTLPELLDELEVAHPQEVADFERRHPLAITAVIEDGYEQPQEADDDELEEALTDLREDLQARLRI